MTTRTTSIKDFLCDLPEEFHQQFLGILAEYDKETADLTKDMNTAKVELAFSRDNFQQINNAYNHTYAALKQSMVLNTTLDKTNTKLDETNTKLMDITSKLAADIEKLSMLRGQSFHTLLPLRRETACDSVIIPYVNETNL